MPGMQVRDFATTFHSGLAEETFARRATPIAVPEILDRLPRVGFRPYAEFTLFFRVLRAMRRHHKLLLFSSRGYAKPELLAAVAIGLLPRSWRPTVVFYGEMYEPSAGLRGAFERLAMRLAQPGIARYVLFSDAEHAPFKDAWRIPSDRVATCHCFLPEEPATPKADDLLIPAVPYVFSGGSSFRDFGPVIGAARLLSDTHFVIAADRNSLPSDLPANVSVASLERDHYRPLLEAAATVVVPLSTDLRRAAGMFTYLRAMQLGKAVIVSDAIAVNEYVDDERTGIVVTPTAKSYAEAIRYTMDPANQESVWAMGARAAEAVERRFTIGPYATRMLAILDEATRLAEGSLEVAA